MNELQQKVIKQRIRHTKWLREHYHYARSFGFTAAESTILMNRSKENIRLAATEYRKTKAEAKDVTDIGGQD